MEPSTIEKAVAMLMKSGEVMALIREMKPESEWEVYEDLTLKIQYDFQLWGDNYLLLNDCKEKLGVRTELIISPDLASILIIDELVKKVKDAKTE